MVLNENCNRQQQGNCFFNKKFEFFAPSYIFSEINKYKSYIIKKVGINNADFDMLMKIIFENISIISELEYEKPIKLLKEEIVDEKDLPYLSLAILIKANGIWTHDPHFKEQNKIKTL